MMTKKVSIKVSTSDFQGPLDLLLSLIEKRKLHISDVSLAKITDDYLSHLEKLESQELEHIIFFLEIASDLLLIKARALLPKRETVQNEGDSILDDRLRALSSIKQASMRISLDPIYELSYWHQEPKDELSAPASLNRQSIERHGLALAESLSELDIPQADIEKRENLDDRISDLTNKLSTDVEFSLLDEANDRHSIVLSFLALLELYRRGVAHLVQDGNNVKVYNDKINTPHYG